MYNLKSLGNNILELPSRSFVNLLLAGSKRDKRHQRVNSSSSLPLSLSQMGASCEEVEIVCLCEAGPCTLYSEAHAPTLDTLLCEHCGKNRVMLTRYSEGYGTEVICDICMCVFVCVCLLISVLCF
ncbi:hypothetical protein ILYODFUR_032038 [Ilyodon furcidens]|uniref:Uncharacterized protein n=1 Tax=Ilyodon furcidens TaxID=33524 RepID=A0ABV0SR82_9TELE